MNLSVIVGLGNPGDKYTATRHNVGVWLLERVASANGGTLKAEKKAMGDVAQVVIAHTNLRLHRPSTYMNESGQAVRRMLDFYKLEPEQMLVLHDELDIPPGAVRLKSGGGHGGHNGLRDIVKHCGRDFMRLRIGIGHPGEKSQVSGFVLKPPPKSEKQLIDHALPDAERAIEVLARDGPEKAMLYLHSR
ncbi:MAG: aminoacyl-tRNA hydrolase [Gammaproteobacteria bacterium]|nr:aminoacyl-tRNA hydrolase [Gammaproteobacteria bacterium]NND54785.1 aminoacyl-tRNA hydrolase [Gammaproteobacteria bacterium]